MRTTYSQTTLEREKLQNTAVAEILNEYNEGKTRRAPCVLMQCVEFNVEFWQALVDGKDKPLSDLRKRKRENLSDAGSEEDNDDSESDWSTGSAF